MAQGEKPKLSQEVSGYYRSTIEISPVAVERREVEDLVRSSSSSQFVKRRVLYEKHTDIRAEKYYLCKHCDKKFARKDNYELHMKQVNVTSIMSTSSGRAYSSLSNQNVTCVTGYLVCLISLRIFT